VLCEHLGARKVLWLGNGIAGDDTHGHVDDLARFVDARTVVIAAEDDPADVNHAPLRENRARLESMTNADGERLRVETLPMPAPVVLDGVRLPASYANFYVANAVVLVPTFNDRKDREALATLPVFFLRAPSSDPRHRPRSGARVSCATSSGPLARRQVALWRTLP
jgi:agmatine deiminase